MMTVKLEDVAGGVDTLTVKVQGDEGVVDITPKGAGTACRKGGPPISLQLVDGVLTLLVWADINQEDPTHRIDMSGSSELCRK